MLRAACTSVCCASRGPGALARPPRAIYRGFPTPACGARVRLTRQSRATPFVADLVGWVSWLAGWLAGSLSQARSALCSRRAAGGHRRGSAHHSHGPPGDGRGNRHRRVFGERQNLALPVAGEIQELLSLLCRRRLRREPGAGGGGVGGAGASKGDRYPEAQEAHFQKNRFLRIFSTYQATIILEPCPP